MLQLFPATHVCRIFRNLPAGKVTFSKFISTPCNQLTRKSIKLSIKWLFSRHFINPQKQQFIFSQLLHKFSLCCECLYQASLLIIHELIIWWYWRKLSSFYFPAKTVTAEYNYLNLCVVWNISQKKVERVIFKVYFFVFYTYQYKINSN